MRLIEQDAFPFEFLSQVAERESWRKEIHRPIYHVHKWWAKRLGSVFRGILLGSVLKQGDIREAFYRKHDFEGVSVFDPFMGSGTTLGEAHKLGLTALGRDINPVAVEAVKVALGPLKKDELQKALVDLLDRIGDRIAALYKSTDSKGRSCDVLYYFWVMQAPCPACEKSVDLFPSYVVASNAYPKRKPEVHVVCPQCGDVFRCADRQRIASCSVCGNVFHPDEARASGAKASCAACSKEFTTLDAIAGRRPTFRLYAKLVLTSSAEKEYMRTTEADEQAYRDCAERLRSEVESGNIALPDMSLEPGYNTRQAISYGFRSWRDFFNDRQLLALGWLRAAILGMEDGPARQAMLILFSGVLEFNNLFASYKGEGTGAVRHMFAHHILKPERIPIEANLWGTPKSSGSFTGLFRTRLLRAIEYREAPFEVNGQTEAGRVCSLPFTGQIESRWPSDGNYGRRAIYVSNGDSSTTSLPDGSVDLVVTDPPFFDNVHYSELADFFHAWRPSEERLESTRRNEEVQDADPARFAEKLRKVFLECTRLLKEDGLLVFTYHHSRGEGWRALAHAILGSGLVTTNAHPVKSEMSVATPKTQAKEPIQLDVILVCRKGPVAAAQSVSTETALESARNKIRRMEDAGFVLSRNDRKIILFGQLLTTIREEQAVHALDELVVEELERPQTQDRTTLVAI